MERMCEKFPRITQAIAELGMLMTSVCTAVRMLMIVQGYRLPEGETSIHDILNQLEARLAMEETNGKHPRYGIPTRN